MSELKKKPVKVRKHKRTLPSGKTVNVRSHTRRQKMRVGKNENIPNPSGEYQKPRPIKKPQEKKENEKRFWLEEEATIYVPSTRNGDEKISKKEFEKRIKNTQEEFTKRFGGTTTFKGYGTYVDNEGEVIEEKVAVVEFHMSKGDWEDNKEDIYKWLDKKQEEWGQESVAFEYEDNMTFVE